MAVRRVLGVAPVKPRGRTHQAARNPAILAATGSARPARATIDDPDREVVRKVPLEGDKVVGFNDYAAAGAADGAGQ